MATSTPLLTAEEMETIPQEREGDRHELIGKVLYATPAPIPVHELVSIDFLFILGAVVRPARLGQLFTAPVDTYFSGHDMSEPDIGYITRDRLATIKSKRIEAAPDLVVEVLSPSTRQRDLGIKKALYERVGVREYWIVDPAARSVIAWSLHDERYVPLSAESGVIASTVIPGVSVDSTALFATLPEPAD